jgi:hypothetical protein
MHSNGQNTHHGTYQIQGLTHSALGRYGRFCVRFCLWYLHSWIRTTKKPSSRYLHPHGNVTVSDATLPSQTLYYIHPDHIFKPSSRADSQQQQQVHLITSARRIIRPGTPGNAEPRRRHAHVDARIRKTEPSSSSFSL